MELAHSADLCQPVRLDDPDKSMSRVLQRDQGRYGTCYAQTAVQMYDAWRFSHGDKNKDFHTSGLMAAVMNVESSNEASRRVCINNKRNDCDVKYRTDIDGAYRSCNILNTIQSEGACSETTVLNYFDGHPEFTETYKLFNNAVFRKKMMRATGAVTLDRNFKEFLKTDACDIFAKEGLRLDRQDIQLLVESMEKGDVIDILSVFRRATCVGKNLKYSFYSKSYYRCYPDSAKDVKPLAVEIHRLLAQENAQPIGIDFCANLLDRGRRYRGDMYGRTRDENDCGMHAALIIGQRRNPRTDRCEFLIRNSWGVDAQYSSDWEKSNGNVWVDGNDLINNSVHYYSLAK